MIEILIDMFNLHKFPASFAVMKKIVGWFSCPENIFYAPVCHSVEPVAHYSIGAVTVCQGFKDL